AELAVIHGEPAETLGEKAVADMKFGSNMRGSAEYREAIAKVLVRRAANAVLEES
ncbi:MAG: molybdopterin dehydrogenase, partial [Anaerostipes caccae]